MVIFKSRAFRRRYSRHQTKGLSSYLHKENSNRLLALRCAIVNGTLDTTFNRYVAREQAEKWRAFSTCYD